MRYQDTVLGGLLKPISRRGLAAIVSRHDGDRYVKGFSSWDHLVTMIYAQLGGIGRLRELVPVWNARAAHHYHLGSGPICRSTMSDANRRRPSAIFAEVFAELTALADRSLRRQGEAALRLIDATPIPLGNLYDWACWNGRTRGLKAHLIYDPDADRPVYMEVTPATVNDVNVARERPVEPGATYVFDKAYVDYRWWRQLHDKGCIFVTRPKTNIPFTTTKKRRLCTADQAAGIFADATVRLASQQKSALPIELRRIELRREDGRTLSLITNDLDRPAHEVAALYRKRWQIELLFRWIKQHLKIRAFLGRSENAVRLQLFAALIAFLLLRIAAAASRSALPALRFADLVRARLLERSPLARIDRPPEPTSPPRPTSPNQLAFAYA